MHQWQSHLNHLMMLPVHKDRTDALTLVDVVLTSLGRKKTESNWCTKKYALTDRPKQGGGGLMLATRPAPPQSFYACYGPDLKIEQNMANIH